MRFLALKFALLFEGIQASRWTVTSRYVISVSTSQYSTYTDDFAFYTRTSTFDLVTSATPTVRPVSSTTSIFTYKDVTVIELYYAAADVPPDDIVTTTTTGSGANDRIQTDYKQSVVYTAPASCPTPFTVATTKLVYVPTEVTNMLRATSTHTSVVTYAADPANWYTRVEVILPQDEVPITTTDDGAYMYYIASCRNPTATGAAYWGPSYRGGGGGNSGPDDLEVCSLLTGCTTWRTWVIVVASVLPALFILGFLESWFWYRRLMTGRYTLRFGTICWILLSLWILCFTRSQPSRSAEDQAILQQRWKEMSVGQKWKNWWKWGFRHSYPVDLLGHPGTVTPSGPYAAHRSRQVPINLQRQETQQEHEKGLVQGEVQPPPPPYHPHPHTSHQVPVRQPDRG